MEVRLSHQTRRDVSDPEVAASSAYHTCIVLDVLLKYVINGMVARAHICNDFLN